MKLLLILELFLCCVVVAVSSLFCARRITPSIHNHFTSSNRKLMAEVWRGPYCTPLAVKTVRTWADQYNKPGVVFQGTESGVKVKFDDMKLAEWIVVVETKSYLTVVNSEMSSQSPPSTQLDELSSTMEVMLSNLKSMLSSRCDVPEVALQIEGRSGFTEEAVFNSIREIETGSKSVASKIKSSPIKEFDELIQATKKRGLVAVVQSIQNSSDSTNMFASHNSGHSHGALSTQDVHAQLANELLPLLSRQFESEDLTKDATKVEVQLQNFVPGQSLDIFDGPKLAENRNILGKFEPESAQIFPVNTETLPEDEASMHLLIRELNSSAVELHGMILDNFRDLMLSDNFVFLLRRANSSVSDLPTRRLYSRVAETGALVTAELAALAERESAKHLDTIHAICEVAAKYQHIEEEFVGRMDELRPRLDTSLLAYLKFAIDSERKQLMSQGKDESSSSWLRVLLVVQRGVLAEFEARFQSILEPLLLTIRFDDDEINSQIFERFVKISSAVDLPFMRELAMNMYTNIFSQNSVPDVDLFRKMVRLRANVDKFLSKSIIHRRLEEFRADVAAGGGSLRHEMRNPNYDADNDAYTGM